MKESTFPRLVLTSQPGHLFSKWDILASSIRAKGKISITIRHKPTGAIVSGSGERRADVLDDLYTKLDDLLRKRAANAPIGGKA